MATLLSLTQGIPQYSSDVHFPIKYSKTRAMYAVSLLFIGHLRIYRLKKPSVLFAFLVIVDTRDCSSVIL